MDSFTAIRIAIFISCSLFLAYVSRKSLLHPETHGFYRFFVFELSLLLIVINLPHWFVNPFSLLQIISWISLLFSIYLVLQSVYLLKNVGGQKKRKVASANYEFEDTVHLVNEGIYKYIRHPMYASLLFLSFGAFLKNISIGTILLMAIILVFLITTAKMEEKENIEFFGPSYVQYIGKTKMFVPFIF